MFLKILVLKNTNTYYSLLAGFLLYNPANECSYIIDLDSYQIVNSFDFNAKFYMIIGMNEIIVDSNAKVIVNKNKLLSKHHLTISFCKKYFRFSFLDYTDWLQKDCFIIKPYELISLEFENNKIEIECKIFNVYKISSDLIVFGYSNKNLIVENHNLNVKSIKLQNNVNWGIKIDLAEQFVGKDKENLSFQKMIGHVGENLYFSLNDGRIYEVNVHTGDYTIIHQAYSQIRYGQYLDQDKKEIYGSENNVLEVLDLTSKEKSTINLESIFLEYGMTGVKNLLYTDKKHLYFGDNMKGGILILERKTYQPVWYEKTKPVLDIQIDGDHMAVYHMGNQLTLYKRTDTLTDQEKKMATDIIEMQKIESQLPKKIVRPGFKVMKEDPHQRNGVTMPVESYWVESKGFYHEGHFLDLLEGMSDLTHGALKIEDINIKPLGSLEIYEKKCEIELKINGKNYSLTFTMFHHAIERFSFLSEMNQLMKNIGYDGGNVFCDVSEDIHFFKFVFVTSEKYFEMDKAGIVCHPFDSSNY